MYVSNMAALWALTAAPTEEIIVGGYYAENDGGGGTFIWRSGIAPADDGGTVFGSSYFTLGLNGGWFQRVIPDGIINAKWFGAAGDGVADDTDALQSLAAYINAQDGGEVFFPEGTYLIGRQTFVNTGSNSYAGETILYIAQCGHGVVMRGENAVFKIKGGLKYGAFYPNEGHATDGMPYYADPANHDIPTPDPKYKATIGYVFYFALNKKVVLEGLSVDGNLANLEIGGRYGDTGYQCEATGFYFYDNDEVIGTNLKSNCNALDGFLVANITVDNPYTQLVDEQRPKKEVALTGIDSVGNGRQGLSWNGGNHLCIINGRFNDTGRTFNTSLNSPLYSSPGSGMDIEPEYTVFENPNYDPNNPGTGPASTTVSLICQNGYFANCEFNNNKGWGMVAAPTYGGNHTHDCRFKNCQFIATNGVCVTPSQPRLSFDACKLVGTINGVYGDGNNPANATAFRNCTLEIGDASAHPTNSAQDFYYAYNAVFDTCHFKSTGNTQLPVSTDTIYRDCSFKQEGTGTAYTNGWFYGETVYQTGGVRNAPNTRIFGRYVFNGTELPTTYSFQGEMVRKQASNALSYIDIKLWHFHNPLALGPATKNDTVFNTSYALGSGSPYGWVCVQSGNPGVWEPFGILGMVQAAASADSAAYPSSTYDPIEMKNILEELRDLKTKLRDANILL